VRLPVGAPGGKGRSVARTLLRLPLRLARYLLVFLVVLAIATTIAVWVSGDDEFTYSPPDTLVNDVTLMNPTYVSRVIQPTTVEEVVAALQSTTGPVSIGGGRYSQGGQISWPGSLHLDMRRFDKVLALDEARKRITVQAGITWHRIQEQIAPRGLAIRIMQTYSNFTVGGSLSVNVHGRYIGEGPLVRSVESIKLVLADGSVVEASPTTNSELFYGAIGGYGGLGVIVEATLNLTDDTNIERRQDVMPVSEYRQFFARHIRDNREVVFHNADLYPPDFDTARQVSWHRTDKPLTIEDGLIPAGADYSWQPRIADWVGSTDSGKWARRHVIDPLLYVRNPVVRRNREASYDVAELEPESREEFTYGLREYFVPVERFDEFVERMRDIFARHDANVMNVSVRHALPDPGTLLAWARNEVFAFVVYYRQGRTPEEVATVRDWSLEMIDAATALGGAYYPPYQVFESPEQFHAAFPRDQEYFALKARVDPDNRFRNRLLQRIYPGNHEPLEATRSANDNYHRGEAQTFLTVPEWYLVFNPVEYAQYLESGGNPATFPFFSSIDEYWRLYDRVTTIARQSGYPRNGEYLTMLRVIGISTTAEYLVKGAYEGSIGRLFRWSASGEDTAEDQLIARAQRAYADFIFDTAWYEFDFGDWVGRMWGDTRFFGRHFLRKLERRLFFTAEFGIKAGYAKLIGFASRTAYGKNHDRIYLTVTAPADDAELPAGVTMVQAEGREQIVSTLRWGPFTEAAVALARSGYGFRDVSGNHRIVVSTVGPRNAGLVIDGATELFESRLVSNDTQMRRVLLVDVGRLTGVLDALPRMGARLEHIYDY